MYFKLKEDNKLITLFYPLKSLKETPSGWVNVKTVTLFKINIGKILVVKKYQP